MWNVMSCQDRAASQPQSLRAFCEWRGREALQIDAGDAVRAGPPRKHDGRNERERSRVRAGQREDGQDRYQGDWKRGGDLGDSVQNKTNRMRLRTECGEDQAKNHAPQPSRGRDRESYAGPVEDQAQQVTAARIGSEREGSTRRVRRGLLAEIEDDVERLVRRDAFAENREPEKQGERS